MCLDDQAAHKEVLVDRLYDLLAEGTHEATTSTALADADGPLQADTPSAKIQHELDKH